MSTRTFGTVGAAIGGAVGSFGGPVGKVIGTAIGRDIGTSIGQKINNKKRTSVGRHLSDLSVQSSAYGDSIPLLYGSARVAGNIIWSLPIKEVESTSQGNNGGGKGGGGQAAKGDNSFSYYITMAIAVCEGKIDSLLRIWADAKIINQADYNIRFYSGSESQLPDSLIESYQGVGITPAYRGMAYVVLEDFPIGDYGNRIPNFTFEVSRNPVNAVGGEQRVEEMVESIVLIPGAGEFVYDDIVQSKIPGELVGGNWVQRGNITRINQNNRDGKADALVSLGQLKLTCPNVSWVAPVVCWFGDSLNAGTCVVKPGVEYQNGATTSPNVWAVGGFNRANARQITLISGSPQYGGTPSDASLLRYLAELKSRGYNIMFNPMMFMDVSDKPWRGRVTGTPSDVANFFTKTNGYNAFITHYANLVKDVVDAFVIGSELIGLTSVQEMDNSFPAVDKLVSLAATVKAILDSGVRGAGAVKVTYAADWSEYHHCSGGWYNLDPLWASSNIDFVGIDAYFPLTTRAEPATGFSAQEIIDGWTEGEGYDFYYSDGERTIEAPLDAPYAWKNIDWWWNNYHFNPGGVATAWVPNSKKIWFTEYGFPSVDGCSNQPNVFYDPNSSESHFPYFSKGRVDFRAQRNAIAATETKWASSDMVERKFLWTWDARPFPFWPDLANIWADGALWKYGHWVQGKFGNASLGAIVADLSKRAGLDNSQIDVSRLSDIVDGYIIKGQTNVHDAIDDLRSAYFFDAVESGGQVKYIKRGTAASFAIVPEDFIEKQGRAIDISRKQELELPQKIDVVYLNKAADYQAGSQNSQRLAVDSIGAQTLGLPIVMSDQVAKNIADVTLYNSWQERCSYNFILPIKYAHLEPTDVLEICAGGATYKVRVAKSKVDDTGLLKISAVAEDSSLYDFYNEAAVISPQTSVVTDPGSTILAMLDLPAMPNDNSAQGYIRYAACGLEEAWRGTVVFASSDAGANYGQVQVVENASVIGVATTILAAGNIDIFDYANSVTVSLYGSGELEGMSELAVLNGANLALLGDEIIQFKNATLVAENKYILSGLLRGRLGTESIIGTHAAGEQFVLINNNLKKEVQGNSSIGIPKLYKGVSIGKNLGDSAEQYFTYNAKALKPFAPVHIKGLRDVSLNLTISWVRRTRLDGQWRDGVDVPLNEASEKYEVDIMNGAVVVRIISGLTAPVAAYSAANQITDFGSAQASVNVRVYQISEIVGRGSAGVAVV